MAHRPGPHHHDGHHHGHHYGHHPSFFHSHGPHPHPPGYVYVPTPVMMPVPVYPSQPEPQPTYTSINNIYQPAAPEPVHVVDYHSEIDWVPATPNTVGQLAHRAVVAGHEAWDKSSLLVIRAHHKGELVPGKLAIKHKASYIPYAGQEIPVHHFELMVAPPQSVRWLPDSNGQVPPGAIPAGNTTNAEPLYVGRISHKKSLTPGKIHPSHGCCYISFGGKEVASKKYEVLCKIDGVHTIPAAMLR